MNSEELNSLDDNSLLTKYKHTENNYIVGVLFQRYTHLIFGVCMKYLKNEDDAQDASMQLFEKLLIDLKKYEIKQFKPWLQMVCKNYCLMQLRSKSSKNNHFKEFEKDIVELNYQLHLTIEDRKETELTLMEDCIKKLNNEQRLCIELFFLQEKSYTEVSQITSLTMNNVKSYIQNGKRNLKICVESNLQAN